MVADGDCCGGQESDPHAVHGIQANDGNFASFVDLGFGIGLEIMTDN